VPELPVNAVAADRLEATIGEIVALRSSTFEVPAGSVTAVIGPNGSGKSTLLNLIAGLLTPSGGTLEVMGTSPVEARARVAYVLQSTKVNETLPVSVREVVTMGRYPSRRLTGRLGPLDRSAVDEAIHRLGLQDLVRRSLHELSGGQRQRVFVAQGLAQEHEMLLLDEPLTGLDLVSSSAIEAVVAEEQAAGRTILLTTHDVSWAMASDWVVLLAGRVVAAGPPGAALSADNLALAYGLKVVRAPDGRFMVDDPAHAAVTGRHSHVDRSIHLESPGGGLHRDG
jgi:manganese transport system ATP-binding protein